MISYEIFKEKNFLIHATSTRNTPILKGQNRAVNFSLIENKKLSACEKNFYANLYAENQNDFFLAQQVHGDKIFLLNDDEMTPQSLRSIPADAIITSLHERPIAVVTADCAPIIIFDPVNKTIAVVHAGRKGTASRIFSKTIGAMQREFGAKPETLLAALGPAIKACCYEVTESCRQPFEDSAYDWGALTVPASDGKFMLDICAANLEDGLLAGLSRDNIFLSEYCTSCRLDLFYSYRREGKTGRMITSAMLL